MGFCACSWFALYYWRHSVEVLSPSPYPTSQITGRNYRQSTKLIINTRDVSLHRSKPLTHKRQKSFRSYDRFVLNSTCEFSLLNAVCDCLYVPESILPIIYAYCAGIHNKAYSKLIRIQNKRCVPTKSVVRLL